MGPITTILIAAYSFSFLHIQRGTKEGAFCKMFNEAILRINDIDPIILERLKSDNKPVMNFLNCEFNYTESYWQTLEAINQGWIKVKVAYPKKETFLKEDGSREKKSAVPEKLSKGNIFFQRNIRSLSGVEINNLENEVILKRNNKKIDLTTALKRYFNKQFIISEFYRISSGVGKDFARHIIPLLYQLNNPTMDVDNYNCLRDSEILALWCLIPQEVEIRDWEGNPGIRKVERHLVGLARNSTGHLFHWSLDLGKDISVLMQYGTKINENL